MKKHGEMRKKIEALDARLVTLLNERVKAAVALDRVAAAASRRGDVLRRMASLNKGPISGAGLEAIYREILSAVSALERRTVVAYFGPSATFTHQAARLHFGSGVDYVACETIGDVFAVVEKKSADYGVVPIENSTEGAVTHTLDEFVATSLKVCAEVYQPISHHLMARVAPSRIRRVYSHPQVFGQCRRWLHENLPGVELVPVSSTARAAELAAGGKGGAALAGALAAELYRLRILERDVQDLGGNTTRFLVIGGACPPPSGCDKTSVFFAVKHKVGALYGALASFKKYHINMTKIESRPSKAKAWEYYFFVDIEGHAEDRRVARALEELSEHCTLMTVLGAYPRAAGAEF